MTTPYHGTPTRPQPKKTPAAVKVIVGSVIAFVALVWLLARVAPSLPRSAATIRRRRPSQHPQLSRPPLRQHSRRQQRVSLSPTPR